jgi:hypothetical protein
MSYFVKVIPPSKRARVHEGDCRHCRQGLGQANQDKGTGPTYWSAPFSTLPDAQKFMAELGPRYTDVGLCSDCKPGTR